MKKLIIATLAITLTISTAYACRTWTYTINQGGRIVMCTCTDCGYGANCNCF